MKFLHKDEWFDLLKIAYQYKLNANETILLFALREVINGEKGNEFKILQSKGTNLEQQADLMAKEIRKSISDYISCQIEGYKDIEFITFFCRRMKYDFEEKLRKVCKKLDRCFTKKGDY